MAPTASSRLPYFAAAVVAFAALVVNACSLNPQPLPPDQPRDSGSPVTAPPPGVDGGSKGGGADATTPGVDSGEMAAADTSAPAPEADGGPDTAAADGGEVDGAEVDGALDGAEVDGAEGDGHAPPVEGGGAEAGEDATGDAADGGG